MLTRRNPRRRIANGQLLSNLLGSNMLSVTRRDDAVVPQRNSRPPTIIPRNITNHIHYFIGNYSAANVLSSVLAEAPFNYTFLLSSLNLASAYTTIFDQYAIMSATVKFIPVLTQNDVAANDTGRLITAIDYDDSNNSTFAQLNDYQTAVVTNGVEPTIRVVYPRIAVAAYQGAFTAFANDRMWVDCAYPSTIHYGLKTVITATTVVNTIRVDVSLVLCFRNTH